MTPTGEEVLGQDRDAGDAGMRRAAERVVLGFLPIVSVPLVLVLAHPLNNFAVDFHSWFWPAGRHVLDGLSPYTSTSEWFAFKYPAPAALLFVPFALLPHVLADWIFVALVLSSLMAALWLLGVRDWRVYGIVMLWQPVIIGYLTANVSLLLVFGLAVCWFYRERPLIVGSVLGLLVSVKLFPIVIAIWLLATRRFRALAWMFAAIAVLNLVAWSVIGWSQVSVYLHVVAVAKVGDEMRAYSLIGLARHLGAGESIADTIGIAAAVVVVALGLRVSGEPRDRIVLSACVAACLLVSPIVESHYLVLLIVPLALARPRLSPIWALPIILLLTPADYPSGWQHALSLAVFAALVTVSMTTRPSTQGLLRSARAAVA